MVRTLKNIVSVLFAALFFCSGCSFARAAETDEPLLCREAEDRNALFDRRGRLMPGWLAADGIYTVKTEENKTVFIFSDTLIGRSDETGKPTNAAMANHSAAVLRGILPGPQSTVSRLQALLQKVLRYSAVFKKALNRKKRTKNDKNSV